MITEKTGWTPSEIRELTPGQINEYIGAWNRLSSKKSKEDSSVTHEDIQMFNLGAGIEKVIRKKISP